MNLLNTEQDSVEHYCAANPGLVQEENKQYFEATIAEIASLGVEGSLFRLKKENMQKKINKCQHWISAVQKEIESLWPFFDEPCVFLLTDPEGIVVQTIESTSLRKDLEMLNIGIGTSFAWEHAGNNAISLAIHTQTTVAINGAQHDLAMFQTWQCVCIPLRIGGEIYGYVDISFQANESMSCAVPLLELLVKCASEKMIKINTRTQLERTYELFDSYELTPREKDVGYFLLQHCTAAKIAKHLGISKETVRTITKNIYIKAEVHSKGQFILTFSS